MLSSRSPNTRLSSITRLSSLSESISLLACSARHFQSRGWCGVIRTPPFLNEGVATDALSPASYSGFKTESEQYSTLRWKTPNVQHEEHKGKMLDCGCLQQEPVPCLLSATRIFLAQQNSKLTHHLMHCYASCLSGVRL